MRSTANYSHKGFTQSKTPENLFLYNDLIDQSSVKHEESNYFSAVIVGEHKQGYNLRKKTEAKGSCRDPSAQVE